VFKTYHGKWLRWGSLWWGQPQFFRPPSGISYCICMDILDTPLYTSIWGLWIIAPKYGNIWQWLKMAQVDYRWTYNLLVILTQHVQFKGFSPLFVGGKIWYPPQMPTFFVGNICGESLHENKKNMVCFITPKSDSSGYSSWFPQAFLCQKPCSAVPAAQNVICPGTHEQINVPCCYNLVHIQITRTRYI